MLEKGELDAGGVITQMIIFLTLGVLNSHIIDLAPVSGYVTLTVHHRDLNENQQMCK